MGLFKTYECLNPKCRNRWEGILDLCGKCGSRGAALSGIQSCLASGRPPGVAGGSTTPHSARSYDRSFERNFKIMGISNLTHKDGVPIVTRTRSPRMKYNTMPEWAGQQQPIKAYSGIEAMQRDGIVLPPMRIEGVPYTPPNVHPVVTPGQPVGRGLSEAMRQQTIITHRDSGP